MDRRIYNQPPLKEVVCEIKFMPTNNWDPTIPNKMYESLKSDFPKKEQAKGIEAEIGSGKDGIRHNLVVTESLLLKNDAENILVNISPNRLIVTHLKPYLLWDSFKKVIIKVLETFSDLNDESVVDRLGLRYINEVSIPKYNKRSINEYFNFYPFIGSEFDAEYTSYFSGAQFSYDQGKSILRLQLASKNQNILMLDLDYLKSIKIKQSLSDVNNALEEAHSRIIQTFESSIKDSLRTVFDERKD